MRGGASQTRLDVVLVDTSLWIRFLSNRPPFAAQLDELLGQGAAGGHDLIFGELLMGNNSSRKQMLADPSLMHQAPVVRHREVVEFVRQRRLHGCGIGWVDTHLLASALVSRMTLWTIDPRLGIVARDWGSTSNECCATES